VRIKIVAAVVLALACAGGGAYLGYGVGRRTGGAALAGVLAGSSDRAVVAAIELEYERALDALVRDLGRAKAEIAGGQVEVRELRRELGASRRDRDAARALLESYRAATAESFASRDDGYRRLGDLGDEFLRRLQGDSRRSEEDAAEP